MDNFNNRDGEEDIFAMMRDDAGGAEESSGAEDGSEYLNDSGPGMEIELTGTDEATRTTTDLTGPKQSGEVY